MLEVRILDRLQLRKQHNQLLLTIENILCQLDNTK